MAVALAVAGSSCSDDDGAASTTDVSVPSEAECRAASRDAVAPAQAFIEEYDGLTIEEWNALDPPPDVAGVQREVQERAQAAVGRGCVPLVVEQELLAAVERLRGEGQVGAAIAAALKGDEEPQAAPRNATASRPTVRPGDDVAAILARVGDGSTVTFEAGSYELTESIVVDVSLELVGTGREDTTISSSAAGLALAFVGPGDLIVRDLALRHTGDDAASVLLAIEGAVTLRRVAISGGVAGTDETGAGHGIVFAFEDLEDFPQRSAEQRAGALVMSDISVTGNEGAGVVLSGDAAPRITDATISGNGSCGICYTGEAAGSVAGSTVEDNGGIGFQVVGASHPTLEGNAVRRHEVGVLAGETSSAVVTANTLEDNQFGIQAGGTAAVDAIDNVIGAAERVGISLAGSSTGTIRGNRIGAGAPVGIEVADTASPVIEGNTVEGAGDVGLSFIAMASGRASLNTITGRDVGIQVGGSAAPEISGNQVVDSQRVGVLFSEQAAGSATGNTVTGTVGSAIQVGGTAHPDINANELRGGEYGLTYLDAAAGGASNNRFAFHRIGIQLAGTAAPSLVGNELDGIEAAAIVYAETSAGAATGNHCLAAAVGIAVAATAAPTLDDNECDVVIAE